MSRSFSLCVVACAACSSVSGGPSDPRRNGSPTGDSLSGGDNGLPSGSFLDPGAVTDDAACATTSQRVKEIVVDVPVTHAETRPVALVIMQDRSSSMIGVGGGDPNGWVEAQAALSGFASDPASAGLNVALGFFPPVATNVGACDGTDCGALAVPMGPLPEIGPALASAMQTAVPLAFPTLLTPTECALRGMISACRAHTERTGEQCAAVLVTDGAPTACDVNVQTLTQVAAQGMAEGVRTFTLGMSGADFAVLNQLSQAGGTDCDPLSASAACDVQSGERSFLDALHSIRETVTVTETVTEIQQTKLDCAWPIPDPPEGETFDRDKVNVRFEAAEAFEQGVGRVPTESDCARYQGGWFYDDPAAPTQIRVCPDTCDIIKKTNDAQIDILLGCETVLSALR